MKTELSDFPAPLRATVKRLLSGSWLMILPLCGLWLTGHGAYIHAKANLAQLLLESAWNRTLQLREEVKPWPWADTWPVARLSVPRLGISRIVLAGTSGEALAFGPGHFLLSAMPGKRGNTVIAGHRDTHFSFIRELHRGEELVVQSAQGTTLHYSVVRTMIVNEHDLSILAEDPDYTLTLITCYPFDAVNPGGPLRYVVLGKRRDAPASARYI